MHICSTWSEDLPVVLGLSSYHMDLKLATLYLQSCDAATGFYFFFKYLKQFPVPCDCHMTRSQVIITSPVEWPHTIGKICVEMPSKSRQNQVSNGFSSSGIPLTGLIYNLCCALRVNNIIIQDNFHSILLFLHQTYESLQQKSAL